MKLPAYLLIPLLAVPLLSQTRAKKAKADDFPTLIQAAGKAFAQGSFGTAMGHLDKARALALRGLKKKLGESMPDVPGFTKRFKKQERQDASLMAAGLGALAPVRCDFINENGPNGNIEVAVRSPLVAMFKGFLQMAAMDPNTEKIGYGEHTGLFKKERGGKQFQLQILIHGKHMVTGKFPSMDEEAFFQVFSQKWVDEIALVLGK